MLFQESKNSMVRISGVSDEMVGTATQQQTGPAIDKRLQGSLAILGWLWDNITKYKKSVAATELEFIREYWSNGQFITCGGNFNSQSIPLLKSDLPLRYDMVLDQSVRYNPNLKEQVWQDLLSIAGPLLKVPAGQQILLKGMKYSHFPTQLVQEIQQAVAQQPPQPPKGGRQRGEQNVGPKEPPEFTQAKIQKMGAETQRTLAEMRKMDTESRINIAKLAVDSQASQREHGLRAAELQQKGQQGTHQMLMDRVAHARQAQQDQQQMALQQQQNGMQGPPQPQPQQPPPQQAG
jgi:hypothetical protein